MSGGRWQPQGHVSQVEVASFREREHPRVELGEAGLRQGGHAQSLVGDSAPKPLFISLHRVQTHGGCSSLVTLSRNGELEPSEG